MSRKIHIPPFKIQGIKSKLVTLIKSSINIGKSTLWIEPFMGSGVVGLNIAPQKAIFSDLNPHIINFYNQLKNKTITTKVIKDYLEEQGALLAERDDKHYYFVRDRFNKEHGPLDFLFLNRSCFNGMIRFNRNNLFNVPYGHKPNRFSKAYITKIVNQVRYVEFMIHSNNWTFVCQSFEKTISMANENSFIYCDPPYIGRHVDYFDSWDEEREKRLKECLYKSNSKFMLSTWDNNKYRTNPYLNTIWKGFKKITHEHFYYIGAKEDNRNAMIEALLINYPLTQQKKELKIEQLKLSYED
jgi:DNA adenine methylase